MVALWDEAAIFKTVSFPMRKWIRFRDDWFRRNMTLGVTSTREHQRIWEGKHVEPITYMPHACYLDEYLETDSPFKVPTFVYMGDFYPPGDQYLMFEAVALLKKEGLEPQLEIMGGGPDLSRWKRYVEVNGLTNIRFAGYLRGKERYRHLRHAHALLFPMRPLLDNLTRCPSKTLAYAQVRRPIITNRVGEIAEMLGDYAIYVEPTPEGFATAIRDVSRLLDIPDVDYHVERHTWSIRADLLLSELDKLENKG